MSRKLKFISRLLTLAVLVTIVVLVFRWCTRKDDCDGFAISDTPIKVEMIRNIAEISTISYRDEVVVDSVELYQGGREQFAGSLLKLVDPKDFKYSLSSSPIKRRITLIVKGEIRYGFDLKKHPVKISETDSLVEVFMPRPQITDTLVTPSGTEFFQEHGDWNDYEIRVLHARARQKLVNNALQMNLEENAKGNMSSILKRMIGKDKAVLIHYE